MAFAMAASVAGARMRGAEDLLRNPQLLRRVVGTRLFTSRCESRLAPVHRQVAEFLAAQRLADLIAEGLPAGRVLSLMIGFDGGMVSDFRGLAAWLAALSRPARHEIIERDPLGVVQYGDGEQFGPPEKRLLFQALKGETDRNPRLVSYTSSDSPLRSLVGPDLENDMRQARVHRLAETAVDTHAVPQSLKEAWNATVLETLVRLIGPYAVAQPDTNEAYRVALTMEATWNLAEFIDRLAQDTSPSARRALESLSADVALAKWRAGLLDRLDRQESVGREANFVHPSLDQIAEVIGNGRPANAADLAALATDKLRHLARSTRDGATSDWRQYWNVDQYSRPQKPKPEDARRDALLSDLRQALTPLGIEALAEGRDCLSALARDTTHDSRYGVRPGR